MSIEAEARKSLHRVVIWRLVGDLIALPRAVAYAIASWIATVEKTVFYMELDAARRYRAITNVDLALAVGEPTRYSGLAAGAAERRDLHFHPDATGEDED